MRTMSPILPSFDPKRVLQSPPITPIEVHLKLSAQFPLQRTGRILLHPQLVGIRCASCPGKLKEGELVVVVERNNLRRLKHLQCPA